MVVSSTCSSSRRTSSSSTSTLCVVVPKGHHEGMEYLHERDGKYLCKIQHHMIRKIGDSSLTPAVVVVQQILVPTLGIISR
jgi:hypothetical protein